MQITDLKKYDGFCRYTYETVDGVTAPIRKYVIYLDESFLIANRNNLRSDVIDGLILHEIMHARDYFDNPDHLDAKFQGTYDAHGDHFQHLAATYGGQQHIDPRLVVGGSDIYSYTMSTYNRQTGTTKYATPSQITTNRSYTIGAHGQSGKPMIFGVIKSHPIASADVAWVGSIPVQQQTGGVGPPFTTSVVRWLTLSCDDTNILAFESIPNVALGWNLGSMSIDYEIHIFDVDLDSSLPTGTSLRVFNDDGILKIETPNGVFSMDRRYLRTTSSGGLRLPGGKTISTEWTPSGDSNPNNVTWRCWHGSGGLDVSDYWTLYDGAVTPPSWTPRVEDVTR